MFDNDSSSIESAVTEIMLRCGIPPHIKGYQYIRTAIVCSIHDMSLIDSVTKRLYPLVAKHYGSTANRVNRSIRTAIEAAWYGGEQSIVEFFRDNHYNQRNRPTNAEFIAFVADKLRLELKSGRLLQGKSLCTETEESIGGKAECA